MTVPRPTATVYSATECGQCTSTYAALERYGFDYTVINIDHDPDALRHVTDTLGYRQVPVVEAAGQSWSGFRPDRLKAIANNAALADAS